MTDHIALRVRVHAADALDRFVLCKVAVVTILLP